MTQWNNSDSVAHDDGKTLVAEWEQSSRREGGCEHRAPRMADCLRYLVPIPGGCVHHAVHLEDQRRSFPSGIAGLPAWAGKP